MGWLGALADDFTVVAQTAIDSLPATGQSNGQTFTAAGSGDYKPECVTVTNFADIKAVADKAGEGREFGSRWLDMGAFVGRWHLLECALQKCELCSGLHNMDIFKQLSRP